MFLDINYFLNKKYIQLKKVINSFIDLWLTEEMDTYTTSIKKNRAYDYVRKNNSYMFLFLLSGSQKVMVYIFLKIVCKI